MTFDDKSKSELEAVEVEVKQGLRALFGKSGELTKTEKRGYDQYRQRQDIERSITILGMIFPMGMRKNNLTDISTIRQNVSCCLLRFWSAQQ